ncbi:fungal specific transcription factor [Aspergillus terreus]|uniref:Fungal specific transcription factor n=1 Tax=Aspergillus terreus TaxID=33178 RepID=A0A5M3Z764_ASPTE|nr:hypothetical protein ATETN484_0010047400 [Aspergillus terreus]GFF18521.1 fungal specific transcription factor [Aspergillus terreus]
MGPIINTNDVPSYLNLLLSENRRLKEQSAPSANPAEAEPSLETDTSRPAEMPDESNTSVRNPLIGDRAWFHRYDPSAPPIFIGEAACTAFATRFRRFLTGNNALPHIPRTQYVTEENLAAANATNVEWPSLQQARLLVNIAVRQVGVIYHLFLRKSTLDKLEEIYRTGGFDCTINKCKFFALFAFGEAYSKRAEPSSGSRVPGTPYFARALSMVQMLPERTSITHLESLLLLSLFSYYLNRRNSALVLIGTAMRLGLSIGLNHNIPESQLIDPVERQHRVRIWWTIYIFDRMWGSKMGQASQILDDDIHLDMPSSIDPPQLHDEQFSDTDHMTANIKLARIVGETIAKLYSRRKYNDTFLQRVQKLLKALKSWVETLPEHLRLNEDEPEMNHKHVSSLHLAFNQCVILATRPTLLHLLIKLNETSSQHTISQPVLTLGEACIHAARHSHSLILTKWIHGSLPVFGYFHAHYLFSSALVLAMSSFLPIGSASDLSAFETGLEVLRAVSENGNLSAAEFYHNLEQVKYCLDRYRGDKPQDGRRERSATTTAMGSNAAVAATCPPPVMTTASATASDTGSSHAASTGPLVNGSMMSAPDAEPLHLQPTGYSQSGMPAGATGLGFTTAMTFLEPTMQDFLAQSDFDLGLLHPVDTFVNDESLYTCHGLYKSRVKVFYEAGDRGVWSLGSKLVLKDRGPSLATPEVPNIKFVREHTSIPVPTVLESWEEGGHALILMERVPGEPLSQAWPKLSHDERDRIARQTADYLLQLRQLQSDKMQALDGRPLYSAFLFHDKRYHGPLGSDDELWADMARGLNGSLSDSVRNRLRQRMPPAAPYTFSHGDLTNVNIMVENGSLTGIIDWEASGYFPVWWEYALTSVGHGDDDWQWKALLRKYMPDHGAAREFYLDYYHLCRDLDNERAQKFINSGAGDVATL